MFLIVTNVSAKVRHFSSMFRGVKWAFICFANLWEYCIRKCTHTSNLDLFDGSLLWVQSSLHFPLLWSCEKKAGRGEMYPSKSLWVGWSLS